MTEAELKTKLQEEKNKRRNAERREKYLREKINKEMKNIKIFQTCSVWWRREN